MSVQTEHAHSHPSPFSWRLPTQTHNPFFSKTHHFFHRDFDLIDFILPTSLHPSFQCLIFLSHCLHFLACLLCLESAYFAFFFLDGHSLSLSLSHLCFFHSAPSLRLALWLCKSQISTLSGCRLYQQLPSLTPYLTFILPLLFILSFF